MSSEPKDVNQEPTHSDDVPLDWEPKQSKWPLFVAALFVIGVGFGAWKLFFDVKLDPTKILIVVETQDAEGTKGQWWGPKGKVSARYADAMASQLKNLGFEPFSGADPELLTAMEGTESPEDILALARSKGIRWILSGTLNSVTEMPIKGDTDNRIDMIVATKLQLLDTDESTGTDPSEIELMAPTTFLKWQANFESALEKHNVGIIVERQIADVARSLASTDVLSPFSTTEQETTDATVLASKLEPLFQLARRYELALDARKQTLSEEQGKLRKLRARPTSELLSPLDTSSTFIGEATNGAIVTHIESREVFFAPKQGTIRSEKTTDELVLVTPGSGAQRSLFRTYNIFSHPRVSEDGRWVGVVVDHHTRGTSIMRIATEDGSSEELLFTKDQYVSDATPSPDGSMMVYWGADCERCNKSIRVISLGQKEPTIVLSVEETASLSALPQWSADGKSLLFSSEREGFMRSIWSLSIPSLTMTALAGNALPVKDTPQRKRPKTPENADNSAMEDSDDESDAAELIDSDPPEFALADVSPDGGHLLLYEARDNAGNTTRHLVELDLTTSTLRELATLSRRAGWARYSSQGGLIGFRTKANTNQADRFRHDWELAVIDRKSKEVTTLTANAKDEYFLGFSRQNQRIFYRIMQGAPDAPCGINCLRILWTEL